MAAEIGGLFERWGVKSSIKHFLRGT